MRRMLTGLMLGAIVVSAVLATVVWIWLGPLVLVSLLVIFVNNGLYKVPAKDYPNKGDKHPHKGVLVFMGKRQEDIVLSEGWNWVPCRPFFFDVILVNVEKKADQFGPQLIRTPDNAVVSASESIIWKPGIKGHPESFVAYLNSGGYEGVKKILGEMIEDRVKTWGTSNQEGPATWKEAQGLRDDAHAVLARTLLGVSSTPKVEGETPSGLTKVESGIPTCTWMRFFSEPQSAPTDYDTRPENAGFGKDPWANKNKETGRWDWNGLKNIFNAMKEEEQTALREQVKARKKEVDQLRGAKAEFGDGGLGITILGFSVNEIQLTGKAAEAAELEEKEKREMAADAMEIRNVSDRIKDLKRDHEDMTTENAAKIVQVERKKASRTIIEINGAATGLGQDLIGAVTLNGLRLPSSDGDEPKSSGHQRGGGDKQANRGGGGSGDPATKDREIAEAVFARAKVYPSWWDPATQRRR